MSNITIEKDGNWIKVVVVNTKKPNTPQYFSIDDIKSITSNYEIGYGAVNPATDNRKNSYPFDDLLQVQINFTGEDSNPSIVFDIQEVTNQVTWTADFTGLTQAVADIKGWKV